MKKLNNIFVEKDKINAPFLLAASFNGLIQFVQSHHEQGILYWDFYPKEKALDLLNQFRTKTEPRIPVHDVFMAVETWWSEISRMRNEGINYGSETK